MRFLGAAVLVLEAIAIALAVPVAINVSGAPAGPALAVGLGLAACSIVVAGSMKRRWAVAAGWSIQIAALASALVVPMMAVIAVMFAALWAGALHLGRTVDRQKAAAAEGAAAGPDAPGPAQAAEQAQA